VRRLRLTMLSQSFSLCAMSVYDAVSQMRFCKRDISYLASRIPWLEVTTLGQIRPARRRYITSKEEALCILLSRLAMPTRVEYLEQIFFRSKAAINGLLNITSLGNKASRSLLHFRFRALMLRDDSASTTSTASSSKLLDISKAPAVDSVDLGDRRGDVEEEYSLRR
jgi:hypothetical protein